MRRAAATLGVLGAAVLCLDLARGAEEGEGGVPWWAVPRVAIKPAKMFFTSREPLVFEITLESSSRELLRVCGAEDLRNWAIRLWEIKGPGRWEAKYVGPRKEWPVDPVFLGREKPHVMPLVIRPQDFDYIDAKGKGAARKALPTGPYHILIRIATGAAPEPGPDDKGRPWTGKIETVHDGRFCVVTERFEKVRANPPAEGENAYGTLPALPVEEVDRIPLPEWYKLSQNADPALTAKDQVWVLLRGDVLNENDRVWIESVDLRTTPKRILVVVARWKGEQITNVTYRPYFAVHLRELDGGEYSVEWQIQEATFTEERFDENDRPVKHVLAEGKLEAVKTTFKVAKDPLAEWAEKERPKDWPTSEVEIEQAARQAVHAVRAKATGKDESDPTETAHYHTSFIRGDGENIGGTVEWSCRSQKVKVVEVLTGNWKLEERTIYYRYIRSGTVPTWAKKQNPLAEGADVILFLDKDAKVLKVLPDTEWNLRTVRKLLPRGGAPKKPEAADGGRGAAGPPDGGGKKVE